MAQKPFGTKKSFTAQIDEWVGAQEKLLQQIFIAAALRVIEEMQRVGPSKKNPGGAGGHMPVDTGFLRASLVATLNTPSSAVTVPSENVTAVTANVGQVEMIVLAAKLGDSIYAVYTAAYARRMEYGFVGTDALGREFNQSGYGFVRLAAEQWPNLVKEVVAKAKAGM